MAYKPDIFYDLSHLSLEQKKELMQYARSISFDWWVDKLDVGEHWRRQTIEMDFENVLEKCDESTIFNVIHRRGTEEWKNVKPIFRHRNWVVEVGFTTMTPISYYLWININEDKLDNIVNKFNLNKK